MTLEKTLRQQLNNPEAGGFHVSSNGWNITLVSDKSDSLSCALKELTLERATPMKNDLAGWANRIARRATGLMETLRVLEVDGRLGKAILRSQAPTLQDGKTAYYQLDLERTNRARAHLRRYAGDRHHGARSEPVPFVLTHDAIVKLVNDIVNDA